MTDDGGSRRGCFGEISKLACCRGAGGERLWGGGSMCAWTPCGGLGRRLELWGPCRGTVLPLCLLPGSARLNPQAEGEGLVEATVPWESPVVGGDLCVPLVNGFRGSTAITLLLPPTSRG